MKHSTYLGIPPIVIGILIAILILLLFTVTWNESQKLALITSLSILVPIFILVLTKYSDYKETIPDKRQYLQDEIKNCRQSMVPS